MPIERPSKKWLNSSPKKIRQDLKFLDEPENNPKPKLTREECFRILELFAGWNIDQRGMTDEADRVLQARRDLLVKVYKRLEELV
jgi:hypothetical protein